MEGIVGGLVIVEAVEQVAEPQCGVCIARERVITSEDKRNWGVSMVLTLCGPIQRLPAGLLGAKGHGQGHGVT